MFNGIGRSMVNKGPIYEIIPAELEPTGYHTIAVDTASVRSYLINAAPMFRKMAEDTLGVSISEYMVFGLYHQYFAAVGYDRARVLELLPLMDQFANIDKTYRGRWFVYITATLGERGFRHDVMKTLKRMRTELEPQVKDGKVLTPDMHSYISVLYLLKECDEVRTLVKSLMRTTPLRADREGLQAIHDIIVKSCNSQ